MKSSFELAMERLGGALEVLTDQQKEEIAEIEKKYKAKQADAELTKDRRLKEVYGHSIETEQVLKDYAVELASINSQCEREKEKVRER